ncbi:MAG TPA: glycosyltransferase [Terriglobia bacterium]|nr:glycosyltransferase [Terriglobia bacterium]
MKHAADNLLIVSVAHRASGEARISLEFPTEQFTTITTEDLAANIRKYIRGFRTYQRAVLYTYDLDVTPQLAIWLGILWWIGRQSLVLDTAGKTRTPSLSQLLLKEIPRIATELCRVPFLLRRVKKDLRQIAGKSPGRYPGRLSIAYLRTDSWLGVKSGGSVTHIAGVANSFRDLGVPIFFVTSDRLQLIDERKTPVCWITYTGPVQNIQGAQEMIYNARFIKEATKIFAGREPTLIYQRYSQYNYSGAYLAAICGIPFVLEYNGSEIWIAKNWGPPMRFSGWAEEIERSNLQAADAIVVVSQPLKDALTARGIAASKILVNPNGVDVSRFDPDIVCDESIELRTELGLQDKIIVGFVGTFGRWHGAEILARAIRPVVERDARVHFLFIGDGTTASQVREIIRTTRVSDAVTLTGMIAPEGVPRYLGACDICVAPHIPNPDGTPFFGSPTKLFEYMAMARGIVASRLDQIAVILEEGKTALLVTPGSVDELVDGILKLAGSPDICKLMGSNARRQVMANYTWLAHTSRILAHVRELVHPAGSEEE